MPTSIEEVSRIAKVAIGAGLQVGGSKDSADEKLAKAMMTGLVLSPNLLQTYIFWELVGLCSYLLIGFWWHKPEAAAAASATRRAAP